MRILADFDRCFYNGTVIGGQYANGPADSIITDLTSALDCQATCNRLAGCKHFMWRKSIPPQCHLYKNYLKIDPIVDERYVTGPKRCPIQTYFRGDYEKKFYNQPSQTSPTLPSFDYISLVDGNGNTDFLPIG